MSSAVVAVIVAVTVSLGTCFGLFKAAEKNMRHVHGLQIPSVDLSQLPDSTYNGSYSYLCISYKVAVKVKNKRIEEIRVTKNRKQKHAKMAEGIVPRVLEAQDTNVDAVTGATTTSKALLMAVYNALTPESDREER